MEDQLSEQNASDLFEHFSFTADKEQSPLRVDKFLMNFLESITRSKVQEAAKAGNVWVNGESVKSNHKVKALDKVKVLITSAPSSSLVVPEDIPIDIVYEDKEVLVVNKPSGMVVHPGHGNYSGTLVNALKYHFDNLPSMNAELERPGLVHRIDKDTSGLLVIAKTEFAMNHLAKQFFDRTTERLYKALVWGNPEQESGTIVGDIGRNPKNRLQMMVTQEPELGKHAVTHYKVVRRYRYVSLVECKLETGRTHQIRVHLKHIGHTLFADSRYGGSVILKGTTFTKYKQFVDNCFKMMPRTALHAETLGFTHPTTGEKMYFEAPLPEDFSELIKKWENYSN